MAGRAESGPKGPPGQTRAAVKALKEEGLGTTEIARRLGVNRSTVVYRVRRLHLPIDERFGRRYDWDEIRRAYDSGLSMRQCVERFGCSRQAWAEAVARGAIVPRPFAMPLEELLVVGRKTYRSHLKLRLLNAGLKENRCEQCGISEWNGKPLNMALHHINGNGLDNRLANLVLLCPNCHAQTPNYGGKNGHRRKRAGGSAETRVEVAGSS